MCNYYKLKYSYISTSEKGEKVYYEGVELMVGCTAIEAVNELVSYIDDTYGEEFRLHDIKQLTFDKCKHKQEDIMLGVL